ncbi:zonadhesin-like isoform X2 [Branchiostoma floridae x Branchiostoma belcheri]
MGPDCQEQNGCLSHPCMYGGTCHPIGQARYYCRCTDGYISRDCDPEEIRPPRRPDPCSGRPCWNAGVCVPDGTTFSCVCRHGFHGNVCQFVVPTPAPTDPPAAEPSFLLYRVLIPAAVSVLVGVVFVTVLSCCSDKTDFKVEPEEKVERFATSEEDDEDDDECYDFDDEGLGPSVENSFVIVNNEVENCVESGAAPPSEPPLVLQQKAMYMPPRNTQSERRWLSQIKKVALKLRRNRSLERF